MATTYGPAISKQAAILAFLGDFWLKYGHAPTLREIQLGCSLSSVSVVSHHLTRLRDRGLITWQPEIARTAKPVAMGGKHCPTCRCGEAHS